MIFLLVVWVLLAPLSALYFMFRNRQVSLNLLRDRKGMLFAHLRSWWSVLQRIHTNDQQFAARFGVLYQVGFAMLFRCLACVNPPSNRVYACQCQAYTGGAFFWEFVVLLRRSLLVVVDVSLLLEPHWKVGLLLLAAISFHAYRGRSCLRLQATGFVFVNVAALLAHLAMRPFR